MHVAFITRESRLAIPSEEWSSGSNNDGLFSTVSSLAMETGNRQTCIKQIIHVHCKESTKYIHYNTRSGIAMSTRNLKQLKLHVQQFFFLEYILEVFE